MKSTLSSKEALLQYLRHLEDDETSICNEWCKEPYILYRDRLILHHYDKVVSTRPVEELYFYVLPYINRFHKFKAYQPVTYDEIEESFKHTKEIDFTEIFGQTDEIMPQAKNWLGSLSTLHQDMKIKKIFAFVDYFMETQHNQAMKLVDNLTVYMHNINSEISVQWSVNPYAQYPDFITGITFIVCLD